MIFFSLLVFLLSIYAPLFVIGKLLQWLRNGFNFDRIRAENAFLKELRNEKRAQQKLENERLAQEWKAKRMEHLGY